MGNHNAFEDNGFVWIRNALSQAQINTLHSLMPKPHKAGDRLASLGAVANELNKAQNFKIMLETILPDAFPVRGLAFIKTPQTSWTLPWHQDRVIAVQDKYDVEGFTNWTRKSGVWHCEPPSYILDNMIFIQILLDDIHSSNGPMEVAIGSHKNASLNQHEISASITPIKIEPVIGKAGDIFCSKALMLHRSIAATENLSRRTLRIDFANQALPPPLSYYY
jgi:hypothetical protein